MIVFIMTVIGMLTEPAMSQPPSVIPVPGIVRDFKRIHPDFDVMPLGGYGHYAGNLDFVIGANSICETSTWTVPGAM